MNRLDELRDNIEHYSERGVPRGADQILAAAGNGISARAGRFRYLAVALLLLVCLSATAAYALLRHQTHALHVVTSPTRVPAGPLRAVNVSDGMVSLVKAGFGRVWVATLDQTTFPAKSHLRSFDLATGRLTSDAAVVGDIYSFGVTDHYAWIRTSTGGPASFPVGTGGLGDNAIYRVEPATGTATAMRYLIGDGPLATNGTRIAAADFSHVEILDETGTQVGASTIDQAVGVPNATAPGTNGIQGMSYGPAALYALHAGRREVLELDPNSGRHLATHHINDSEGNIGPIISASATHVLIEVQVGGLIGVTTPFTNSRPRPDIALPNTSGAPEELQALNDHQILVRYPSAVILIDDTSTPAAVEAHIDTGKQAAIVILDTRPWIAQWTTKMQADDPTVVSFTQTPLR